MAKQKGESKVVAYFLPNKALIKFDGEEDSVQVADNVMAVSDFVKYPILKGDVVEVTVKDDEIVFLRKVKGAKKTTKTTTKSEPSTSTGSAETKTVSVLAVARNKEVVKFDKDGAWIKISKAVQEQDYDVIGLVAGQEIEVTLTDDAITYVKKVAKEEKVKETGTTSKKSSYRDEESTDKRTASMCAKDVVVALIQVGREEVNDIDKIKRGVEDLTKTFYKSLKNL